MRPLLLSLLVVFAIPAFADDWSHYDNARFGYAIDIPPGYLGRGASDNGDGQVFEPANGIQTLTVWGGFLVDGFEAEVASRMTSVEADGWNLTYQATTPHWASFSGKVGTTMLYQRLIEICHGSGYAAFQLQYSAKDIAAMDEVLTQLVQSLQEVGGAC